MDTNQKNPITNSSHKANIKETKSIIDNLLLDIRKEKISELLVNLKLVIDDLHNENLQESKKTKNTYYAICFEQIELRLNNPNIEDEIIYMGFGIDLEMQKTFLGYWYKAKEENNFQFWLRTCRDLKSIGIEQVQVKELSNFYWLTEAMNKVFREPIF